MPRPKKCRKVCMLPPKSEFLPVGCWDTQIILTVDEYEAIRLIDMEELSQEECARYMQVARTTVQAIYNEARKKLALALTNGSAIKIDGGDYSLCKSRKDRPHCKGCLKHCK